MPRSGATAMKHAHATLLALGFPLVLKSGKRIVRKPDGTMFALAEDLFSAFDLMGVSAAARPKFVQVTSQTRSRSTVAARQRKIEQNFVAQLVFPNCGWIEHFTIEVWSWVDRTGFRVWEWSPGDHLSPLGVWREVDLLKSPLLKSRSAKPPIRQREGPMTAQPFKLNKEISPW